MDGVKESVIDPLLKKAWLDKNVKNNYRPVNNLLFFSKLIVKKRLETHKTINNLHIDSQHAYKKNCNTETMLLGIVNEALRGFDDGMCTIVVFLDLSAAFDTVDTKKLLDILENEIGITANALKWFNSNLTGRTQRVKIKGNYSDSQETPFGVPQGSILGPTAFNIYV